MDTKGNRADETMNSVDDTKTTVGLSASEALKKFLFLIVQWLVLLIFVGAFSMVSVYLYRDIKHYGLWLCIGLEFFWFSAFGIPLLICTLGMIFQTITYVKATIWIQQSNHLDKSADHLRPVPKDLAGSNGHVKECIIVIDL